MGTVVIPSPGLETFTDSPLTVGPFQLISRLIVGSGRYENAAVMRQALDLSGSDCITVAVRRERLHDAEGENLLDHIDSAKTILLPNTAGCYSADVDSRRDGII